MPPLPPVTKAFMLVCTAVFCAQLLLGRWFEGLFALWPLASGNFMPWQVLTYAFLHGDFAHLFFVQFLIAGALAAALVQIGWTMVIGSNVPTVGASGALFALLLAFGMLFPNRMIMPLFPPIPMKAKIFVAVFGAFELVLGFMGAGGVAHFAHLGGMLGGFLMIRYWRGKSPFGRR
jgi:membrane associated rhomboid family serine protease